MSSMMGQRDRNFITLWMMMVCCALLIAASLNYSADSYDAENYYRLNYEELNDRALDRKVNEALLNRMIDAFALMQVDHINQEAVGPEPIAVDRAVSEVGEAASASKLLDGRLRFIPDANSVILLNDHRHTWKYRQYVGDPSGNMCIEFDCETCWSSMSEWVTFKNGNVRFRTE